VRRSLRKCVLVPWNARNGTFYVDIIFLSHSARYVDIMSVLFSCKVVKEILKIDRIS